MNLANKLTLFRVILVPFFIAALMAASRRENELSEQEQWIAEHKREVDQC